MGEDGYFMLDARELLVRTAADSHAEVGKFFTDLCENPPESADDAPSYILRIVHGNSNGRRARRVRDAAGFASTADNQARIDFYGGLCWICRERPGTAMDHVKPLAKGGSNWPANLRPACQHCNSRKGSTWPFVPERMAA